MRMIKTGKALCLAALLAALLITSTQASNTEPGKGVKVTPGRATWTTGFFQEALYRRALEELGYEVSKPRDLSNPVFYQALCQGDVEYWANGWFPNHDAQIPENFDQHAKIAGYVVKAGGLQGYLVSKKAVEQFNITSLDDFKQPDVKEAFDANGDGKADLVACPPGWGCEKLITHHLKVYDLNDHINPIKAAYSAGIADAVGRYENGKPVLFYTWTPNWTISRFKPGEDVMWINVPEIIPFTTQQGKEDLLVASGLQGAVTDPIQLGFTKNDIAVVANKDFLGENPAAAKLFQVMSLSLEDIAAQNLRMFKGEDSQRDIERHVDEWIIDNQATWKGWLEEARQSVN